MRTFISTLVLSLVALPSFVPALEAGQVSVAAPAQGRVLFVGSSIFRRDSKELWDVIDAVNRQVAAYAAETKRAAYVEFARILKPVLTKAFETPQ